MRCSQARRPRIGTGHLRRCPAGDLSLLEAGVVSATIDLDCPVAAQAWRECSHGDRLSSSSVLCSRVGGSRRQGCLRFACLSEKVATAVRGMSRSLLKKISGVQTVLSTVSEREKQHEYASTTEPAG